MASQTRPRESQNRYLGVGLCGGPGKGIIYHDVFLSSRVGELHWALTSLVGTFGLKEKVSVDSLHTPHTSRGLVLPQKPQGKQKGSWGKGRSEEKP